jgi:hypothetical protein
MDIGSILLGLALLVVVALYVARPLMDPARLREREPGPADALLAEREQVLTALRDLDFDHAMGKITDEDHAPQRAALVAQGVSLLKQLDALGVSTARPAAARTADAVEAAVAQRRARTTAPAGMVDQDIEARVAERRALGAGGGVTCAECGTQAGAGDRFCPKCGARLPEPVVCAQCGRPAVAGDRFCAGCGQPLAEVSPSTPFSQAKARR